MTQRRGFTLIEVLIALVIMGIVTGALYRLLNTSQRLTLAQSEQVSLQSNVRAGSLVVPSELRELNTVVGAGVGPRNDILDAQLTSVQYRAMRGMGFTCQAPAAPVTVITLNSSKLDRSPRPRGWTGTACISSSMATPTMRQTTPGSTSRLPAWLRRRTPAAPASRASC